MFSIFRDHILREKKTFQAMLRLYCRAHHQAGGPLCEDCRELLQEAWQRLDHCRYQKTKPPCGRCPANCYPPATRSQVRQIMAFSGPRMLLHHPLLALLHLLDKRRDKAF